MTDYEKLEKLYSQIDELIECSDKDTFWNKHTIWGLECERFLTRKYGKKSIEIQQFSDMLLFNTKNVKKDDIKILKSNLKLIKNMFENFLEDMIEEEHPMKVSQLNPNSKNIFIVHGRDETLKSKVETMLIKVGLNPIILSQQGNAGDTIIEKIERYGNDVGAAIILFTPDDVGKAKTETKLKDRARQNVVYEAGFFMGTLGRRRTIAVVPSKDIELPNDLSGIVYIPSSDVRDIAKELQNIGFNIDMNKL